MPSGLAPSRRAAAMIPSLILPIVLVFARADPPGPGPRFEFTEPHMGTRFRVVLYAPDEAKAKEAARAAFDRVRALDECLSDYKPAGELMRLCAKAGGDPVPVSPELFFVLSK